MTIKNKLTGIILVGALAGGCGKATNDFSLDETVELCTGVIRVRDGPVWFSGSHYETKKPASRNLEDGFIDPTKVVVEIIDQDGNQKKEVVLNYKGIKYLMKEDSNGVYLQQYEVIPAKIEPGKIIPKN